MPEASAPASTANLGPGFDCVALALEMRCEVKAESADDWSVEHAGVNRPPRIEDDAVLAAARKAIGPERPLRLQVSNAIPLGRGLGSSSAAVAAGALAAWRAVGEEPPVEKLFRLVAEMEGHPDNAAAAVFGGLVLVDTHGAVHRLPWNPVFAPLVIVPTERFSTREARALLPATYTRSTVVASVARTAALIGGLLTGNAELLRAAVGDEIHEAPRAPYRPDVGRRIAAALEAGAVHAAWSGAGPTVVAITESHRRREICDTLAGRLSDEEIMCLDVATRGAV